MVHDFLCSADAMKIQISDGAVNAVVAVIVIASVAIAPPNDYDYD